MRKYLEYANIPFSCKSVISDIPAAELNYYMDYYEGSLQSHIAMSMGGRYKGFLKTAQEIENVIECFKKEIEKRKYLFELLSKKKNRGIVVSYRLCTTN